ncbi:Predicted AT-hook DNA-binding family protein [Prunus dulcis]|uniref:Predicted AT-hook DNA-binding family protein n=1 Tax=Prunus dulcis TaxID=3755 RepID=A0A4Y1QZC1_PRUDU|nr:Predicted AT-hook DNA-binding family protein [Prunus dulcis]
MLMVLGGFILLLDLLLDCVCVSFGFEVAKLKMLRMAASLCMAGLDLGSASRFVHQQLQIPDLHLQRPPDSDDDHNTPNRNNLFSSDHHQNDVDDDNPHHQGLDLVTPNQGSGDSGGRRSRGRPPGSRNKPKPPVIITRESANTLRAHILEVSSGCDVFDSVGTYARKRQRGILCAEWEWYGNQREPASTSCGWRSSFLPPPAPPGATSLTIFLAGGSGQVMGGNVVGALIASGPVIVIASSFTNVAYERLPLEEEEQLQMQQPVPQSSGGGGSGGGGGGGVTNPFPDPSSGLPFFNLPLNNMPHQLQRPRRKEKIVCLCSSRHKILLTFVAMHVYLHQYCP